jgi:DNA-binding transcriptional regulator YiaG
MHCEEVLTPASSQTKSLPQMTKTVYNLQAPRRVESPSPEEVRALRDAVHFTLSEFGEVVYATARTVSSWESGARVCPPASWELMLLYFDRVMPRRFVEDHAARLAVLDVPASRRRRAA